MTRSLAHIALMLIAFSVTCVKAQDLKRVSVSVVDDSGVAVEGAEVTTIFLGYRSDQTQRIKRFTNKEGKVQVTGRALLRVGVQVQKESYYTSSLSRLRRKENHQVLMVLRKIKKPISLYAKRYIGKLPSLDQPCGFDFEVGDWVAPHGEGKISDLMFRAAVIENGPRPIAGRIDLSFPRPKEGAVIVNSENGFSETSVLTMPNVAFADGYVSEISRVEQGYENLSKPRQTSYFFRTRHHKSDTGEDLFNYAKFIDGFMFRMSGGRFLDEPYRTKIPDEYGFIEFQYCWNPTVGDRNLEFDLSKNLFKDLDATERVNRP